jgi:hypothetical protein
MKNEDDWPKKNKTENILFGIAVCLMTAIFMWCYLYI